MEKNRFHELEIIESIDQTSKTYGITLEESTRLVAGALIYKTVYNLEETVDTLTGFFMYPTLLQSFKNKDLHIAYYLTAGVGIDRIRRYAEASQARVYKVKEGNAYIPLHGPTLTDLLNRPAILPNLKYLVQSIRIMNGQYLPDEYYDGRKAE